VLIARTTQEKAHFNSFEGWERKKGRDYRAEKDHFGKPIESHGWELDSKNIATKQRQKFER